MDYVTDLNWCIIHFFIFCSEECLIRTEQICSENCYFEKSTFLSILDGYQHLCIWVVGVADFQNLENIRNEIYLGRQLWSGLKWTQKSILEGKCYVIHNWILVPFWDGSGLESTQKTTTKKSSLSLAKTSYENIAQLPTFNSTLPGNNPFDNQPTTIKMDNQHHKYPLTQTQSTQLLNSQTERQVENSANFVQ